jgi:hypothetical protein
MELVGPSHAKEFGHFLVEKAMSCTVRLDPLAVEDELRNGPLSDMPDNFLRGAGAGLDINLGVGNLVLFKEPFGFAAIAAPRSGIHQNMHPSIISITTTTTEA